MKSLTCPECGVAIDEGEGTCPTCEQNAGHGDRPSPAVKDGESNPVKGVIPNLRLSRGLFRRPIYTLVVTADRIIAVRVTGDMLREAISQARSEAKIAGRGFFGRWGATLNASMAFHQRYLSMDPDDALREHESNFAISTANIKSVRARSYVMPADGRQRDDDLIFKTTSGSKYRFKASANSAGASVKMLRQVLGNRVK